MRSGQLSDGGGAKKGDGACPENGVQAGRDRM